MTRSPARRARELQTWDSLPVRRVRCSAWFGVPRQRGRHLRADQFDYGRRVQPTSPKCLVDARADEGRGDDRPLARRPAHDQPPGRAILRADDQPIWRPEVAPLRVPDREHLERVVEHARPPEPLRPDREWPPPVPLSGHSEALPRRTTPLTSAGGRMSYTSREAYLPPPGQVQRLIRPLLQPANGTRPLASAACRQRALMLAAAIARRLGQSSRRVSSSPLPPNAKAQPPEPPQACIWIVFPSRHGRSTENRLGPLDNRGPIRKPPFLA